MAVDNIQYMYVYCNITGLPQNRDVAKSTHVPWRPATNDSGGSSVPAMLKHRRQRSAAGVSRGVFHSMKTSIASTLSGGVRDRYLANPTTTGRPVFPRRGQDETQTMYAEAQAQLFRQQIRDMNARL